MDRFWNWLNGTAIFPWVGMALAALFAFAHLSFAVTASEKTIESNHTESQRQRDDLRSDIIERLDDIKDALKVERSERTMLNSKVDDITTEITILCVKLNCRR